MWPSKNFYLRWFFGAFAVGFILSMLVLFGWNFYQTSAANQFSQNGPIVILSNPFIDITNPISGKVVASASGDLAFCITAIFLGLWAGILGLGTGAVNLFIRKMSP